VIPSLFAPRISCKWNFQNLGKKDKVLSFFGNRGRKWMHLAKNLFCVAVRCMGSGFQGLRKQRKSHIFIARPGAVLFLLLFFT